MAFKMKGSELYGNLKLNRNMDSTSKKDGRAGSSGLQKSSPAKQTDEMAGTDLDAKAKRDMSRERTANEVPVKEGRRLTKLQKELKKLKVKVRITGLSRKKCRHNLKPALRKKQLRVKLKGMLDELPPLLETRPDMAE